MSTTSHLLVNGGKDKKENGKVTRQKSKYHYRIESAIMTSDRVSLLNFFSKQNNEDKLFSCLKDVDLTLIFFESMKCFLLIACNMNPTKQVR